MKRVKYKHLLNLLAIFALITLADMFYFKTNSIIIKVMDILVIIALLLPHEKNKNKN